MSRRMMSGCSVVLGMIMCCNASRGRRHVPWRRGDRPRECRGLGHFGGQPFVGGKAQQPRRCRRPGLGFPRWVNEHHGGLRSRCWACRARVNSCSGPAVNRLRHWKATTSWSLAKLASPQQGSGREGHAWGSFEALQARGPDKIAPFAGRSSARRMLNRRWCRSNQPPRAPCRASQRLSTVITARSNGPVMSNSRSHNRDASSSGYPADRQAKSSA